MPDKLFVHIYAEVQIDKILIHYVKIKCMRLEMKIGLLFDAVKYHNEEESVYLALSSIFSFRLSDFCAKHPQKVCDIPEAELPDPFNQRQTSVKEYSISQNLPTLYMETTDVVSPVKSACEVNEVFETVGAPSGSYSSANMSKTTLMKPVIGNDGLAAV
ncbi:CDT1-like protein a, chloroplastic isoform X1 [Salvia divinorum]|uniref:CDT1-like protein a, chloroplastic isoform X1 n=1 Tax=Salvia divinorum TaxID=28513 RepID=A0ABD1II32_SALDI